MFKSKYRSVSLQTIYITQLVFQLMTQIQTLYVEKAIIRSV